MNTMEHTHLKIRRGFTIIELTIAVSVVAILASVVTINFSQSRKTARDGVRRADAPAILTAVSQYAQANGTSMIRNYRNGGNVLEDCTVVGSDPAVTALGAGCVGAGGRGYGKINAKDITAGTIGRGGSGVRAYPSNGSIVDALISGGYFDVRPVDPLSKNSPTNDINTRDYVLIRACPNGEQHVGTRGQLFAVWTVVENRLTTSDAESIKKLPGFPTVKGTDTYVYDFAAGTDLSTGNTAFDTSGYGVGNAAAIGSITDAGGECSPNA
jgi:prepilin-type N-terminal cleavage/methylation domain-containing protein